MNGGNNSFPRKYAQLLKQAFSVVIKIIMIDQDAHSMPIIPPTCFSGTFIQSYSVGELNAVVFAKGITYC